MQIMKPVYIILGTQESILYELHRDDYSPTIGLLAYWKHGD